MARYESWFKQDLKKPISVQMIQGNLFSADVQGNLIGVEVFDDGEAATLAGTVSANIIRPDGGTVAASGTFSGNKCSVVLPAAAYAYPGVATIAIKITDSGVVTTLLAAVVTIYRTSTDTVVDPGTIIPSIQSLITQIQTAVASIPADYSSLWTTLAPAYPNLTFPVKAGQYCTNGGVFYRAKQDIATSEEFTSSHWESANIGNELSSLKSALDNAELINPVSITDAIPNTFILASNGSTATNSDFAISNTIELKKGTKVILYAVGYSTNVAMISRVNSNNTYTPLVISNPSAGGIYSYTATDDISIVFCYSINYPRSADVLYLVKTVDEDIETKIEELNTSVSETIKYTEQSLSDFQKQTARNNIEAGDVKDTENSKNILENSELDTPLDLTNGTDGYFIVASNGSKAENAEFKISDVFPIKKGEKVIFTGKGYSTNVAMIAKVNSDNTYTTLVASTSSSITDYEYTATGDINIVFSYNKTVTAKAKKYYLVKTNDDYIRNMLDKVQDVFNEMVMPAWEKIGTTVEQKQVQVYNNQISIANANTNYKYAVQDVTDIERVKIVCHAGQNTSYQVGYIFTTSTGAVVSQYNDTYGEHIVETDVPSGASMLYVNNNGVSGVTPQISEEIKVPKEQYFDLSLFPKFGVVGDSYASGELYYNGSYTDKYAISWGQILARKHGISCTNYSKGGLSTRTWLTDSKGLSLMLSNPAEDLYLLMLGINDYYQLGEDYLGTTSDLKDSYEGIPSTDYDTFYGNYGRIITNIKSHAPYAKIIISTVANTNTIPQMFSDAVLDIAEYYNIPYIVQASEPYFQSTMYTTMSGGHPTAIGYSGMATAFERLIDDCVKNNITYFFDAFMYD